MTNQPPEPLQPGVPSGNPYGTQPGAPYASQPTDPYAAQQPPAAPYGSQPADPYAQQPPAAPYGSPGAPYGAPPTAPYGAQYGAPYGAPVPGGEQPGNLADRLVARIIDGLIVGVVGWIISWIINSIVISAMVRTVYDLNSLSAAVWIATAISAVLQVGIYLGYAAFMESSRGQTVGKMAMKLWVVGPAGGNPTMAEAAKRNIFYAASLLVVVPVAGWFLAMAAGLTAVITIAVGINNNVATRQAWHDMFAGGTRVVKRG